MSSAPGVWRSVLFVPADRPDRFAKALAAGADAVCCDLEDAVKPASKPMAREQIRIFLTGSSDVARIVRVNDIRTPDGLRDLLMLADLDLAADAVWLPKTESRAACEIALSALGGATPVVALIETVAGLRNADAVAATPGVAGLVFGSADYSAELGCAMSEAALAVPRAMILQAAASAGVPAWDGAWADLADDEGLAVDARLGSELGFVGKPALHPRQVAEINTAFTPSQARIEHARGVVAASNAAGGGVATWAGKMLDAPVVRMAERVLAASRGPAHPKPTYGDTP